MSWPSAAADEEAIAHAGVLGQAGMLRDGRLTSVELVDLLLRRIARLDPRIRAFRLVLAEPARAAAAAADRARQAGDSRPLLGVPIAVKDNVDLAGTSSMLGTGSEQPAAVADDELVRRLLAAGMVVIGKTHLPELALWAATESQTHGVTRNPWNPARAPGGSSGGSAAAVAAGMVPAAHATDGLGSIRIPASATGLVGLKPTHGRVPLGPEPDHWEGMSHAGFVTRSVRDTAALLDVATGGDEPAAALDAEGGALRIGVSTRAATPVRPARDVAATLERTVGLLRGLGHTVVEGRHPPYGPMLSTSSSVRYLRGMSHDLDGLADPRATERRTRALAALGRRIPDGTVRWARRYGEQFGHRMAELFDDVDLLLTPTMPVLPRRAGCLAGRGVTATLGLMLPCAAYTGPWNACGLPAVSLPVGMSADGTPVGMQLVGPAGSDGRLLQVAAAVEPLAGWLDRRVGGTGGPARLP